VTATALEDRARGCILAGALGDALGYPIEFHTREEILDELPAAGPVDLPCDGRVAAFSDDTQMTLFAVEGIVGCVHASVARDRWGDELRAAFGRWYRTQSGSFVPGLSGLLGEECLWADRAPGETCLGALQALARGGATPSVDSPPNASKGCGAVMRAAPFGFIASSADEAFELGVLQGVITHGHPAGYASAGALAAVVWLLIGGASLTDAAARAERLAHERSDGALEVARSIAAARAFSERGGGDVSTLGQGWVAEEALAIGLAVALEAERTGARLEAALWRAACHDGDSDSTASIAGHLLGCARGAAALPERWLARLEALPLLDRSAIALATCVPSLDARPAS
jgi:ADP-ribosyl-[dinitrogen reductase] hydrolase